MSNKVRTIRVERVQEVKDAIEKFMKDFPNTNITAFYLHLKSTRLFYKLAKYEREQIWSNVAILECLNKMKSEAFPSGDVEMLFNIKNDKTAFLITTNRFVDSNEPVDIKIGKSADTKKSKAKIEESAGNDDDESLLMIQGDSKDKGTDKPFILNGDKFAKEAAETKPETVKPVDVKPEIKAEQPKDIIKKAEEVVSKVEESVKPVTVKPAEEPYEFKVYGGLLAALKASAATITG